MLDIYVVTDVFLTHYYVLQAVYIGSPDLDTHYATPGNGNVSSDGVHPSSQGCKHISH